MIFSIFLCYSFLLIKYIHYSQKYNTNQLTSYCVPEIQDHWSFRVDQNGLYSR